MSNQHLIAKLFSIPLAFVFCAEPAAGASPGELQPALTPDAAQVHVCRAAGAKSNSNVKMTIEVDREAIEDIRPGAHTSFAVSPGKHIISIRSFTHVSEVEVTLEPGKNLYFGAWPMFGTGVIDEMTETDGRECINATGANYDLIAHGFALPDGTLLPDVSGTRRGGRAPFARIEDAAAVPYLDDKGRAAYSEFVARSGYKVFALADNGKYVWDWITASPSVKLPDFAQDIVSRCQKLAQRPCKVYAVNGVVFWTPSAAQSTATKPVLKTPSAPEKPEQEAARKAKPASSPAYADIGNVEAVPYLTNSGRDAYREYLSKPSPKAFAIATNSAAYSVWGKAKDMSLPADVGERAVVLCERVAKRTCQLYAVDDRVVFTP
jgi:hypothetical protein